jgi:hypothetical protein
MATLSTTAWVLHELGLAAGFGSNLFGQLALNPAVGAIQSKRERGKVSHVAWNRYKAVNGTSLLLMAGTWYAGRAFSHHRKGDKTSRTLTITKDVLVGGALVAGVGAIVFGRLLDRETAIGNEPIKPGSRPSWETRSRIKTFERVTNGFARASVLMNAAVLAVTGVLAVKSGKLM